MDPFDVLKMSYMASEVFTFPSLVGIDKNLYMHAVIGMFYWGIDSNIAWAVVLNGTKIACYDQMKGLVVLKY